MGSLGVERFEVLDALAEFTGKGFQVNGRNIAHGAAEKLLFQCSQLSGEVGKLLVGRGGDFPFHGLPVLDNAGVDLGVAAAAPGDEGGFGDAKLAADAGKTQALDAEPEEFVMGGGRMHEKTVEELMN